MTKKVRLEMRKKILAQEKTNDYQQNSSGWPRTKFCIALWVFKEFLYTKDDVNMQNQLLTSIDSKEKQRTVLSSSEPSTESLGC